MQELFESATLPVYAAALAILWAFEGLVPAFEGWGAARGQRVRHLVLGALNGIAAGLMAVPVVGVVLACEQAGFGLLRWASVAPVPASVIAFLALDLAGYGFHVAAHKLPVLWRLHSVHHHATKMEATAALRFHTLEICLSSLAPIPVIALLGISLPQILLYNVVLMPIAMFHHADFRLPPRADRWLRWVIVTPRMHWIHHSRWQPETDSNYSAVLSIWDRLFGTMRSRRRAETVSFGLDGFTERDTETLRGWLTSPFGGRRAGPGEKPPAHLLEPDGRGDRPGGNHPGARGPECAQTAPASGTMGR